MEFLLEYNRVSVQFLSSFRLSITFGCFIVHGGLLCCMELWMFVMGISDSSMITFIRSPKFFMDFYFVSNRSLYLGVTVMGEVVWAGFEF